MKVLIISHNPISNQNNMGKTFLSLFSQFSQEELCQIYCYPTIPNLDRCTSYYRVTDKDVLRSLLPPWKKPGGELPKSLIREEELLFEEPEDRALYRNPRNKSPVRRLLRDGMWAVSGWYGPALKAWLDREAPECIFVAPGAAKFLHNMALKIAKKHRLPVVTYVCDEYYLVEKTEGLLDRLRLGLLRRKFEQLMAQTGHLVVISQEFKEAYSKVFSVPTTVLMTGTAFPVAEQMNGREQPNQICYFGNLRWNRYVCLAQTGRKLDEINRRLGTGYKLHIYTGEKDPHILGAFTGISSVELHDFVSGAAFNRTFHRAQLLLHVEAFDEKCMDYTKHSISTKIADSLASGIPLLAYGPKEIASMGHLLRNNCAIAATAEEQLEQMLLTAFTNPEARARVAGNGLETAKRFHEKDSAGIQLRRIVEQLTAK